MLRVGQEVQVWAVAVGSAMSVLEQDSVGDRPRHVHEGRAREQLLSGGPSATLAVLKVNERPCKHAIKRGLRVRACSLHNDVGQGQLLRLERPVAAEAGVEGNAKTMAVPARGAPLHIHVSEAESSEPAARANLPQFDYLLKRDVRAFVAAPLAAVC